MLEKDHTFYGANLQCKNCRKGIWVLGANEKGTKRKKTTKKSAKHKEDMNFWPKQANARMNNLLTLHFKQVISVRQG